MTILILNRTIAESYINLSNKESFFEFYEVIVSVGSIIYGFDHAPTEIITS